MKISKYLLLIIVLCTGCITSSYHRSNREYAHVLREFATDLGGSAKVFTGIWAGTSEIKGEKFHRLRFDGLLKGKSRYLDVLIPVKGKLSPVVVLGPDGNFVETKTLIERPGDILFKESNTPVAGGHPAYLFFRVSTELEVNQNNPFLNVKSGDAIDPAVLGARYNLQLMEPHYPLALVELDFANVEKYRAGALVWDKKPGGAEITCVGLDLDYYDGPRLAVKWKERSKAVYGFRQAGYIGTVIADIITSPVQLVLLILNAIAGPAVR